MFFLSALEKISNLVAAFLMTRNLSVILKHCISDLTVIKVRNGMHTATTHLCIPIYKSEFSKPQF